MSHRRQGFGSDAFARFVLAGAGRSGPFRLAGGLMLIVLVWLVWTGIVVAAGGLGGALSEGRFTPADIALVLLSFGGIWAGVGAAMWLLHRERMLALLSAGGGWPGAAMRGLALGLATYLAVLLAGMAAGIAPARTEIALGDWIAWSGPLLALVAVQAGAEELLFRGYLAQQIARLGRIGRHPLCWAVIPAAVFGLLHTAPGLPGAAPPLYVLVTMLFGLTAAALVWRSGGLALPMGLHTGFNFGGLSLVGVEGVLSGAQLWAVPRSSAETMLAIDVAVMAALLLLVLSPAGRLLSRTA